MLDIVAIDTLAERGGFVSYQALAAPFVAPPVPPRFLFGTLPGYLAPQLFGEHEIGGVGCYRLHDAALTFDGIILHRGAALWSLALNHPRSHVQAVLSNQAAGWARLPVRRIAGRAAIIHGPGFDVFGHWLVDFLPRLHVLQRAGLDIDSLKFVLPTAVPAFVRDVLRHLGISEANLVWHDQRAECIAPDELVVPTLMRLRSRFHPLLVPATCFWVERLSAVAGLPTDRQTGRRIFVSRGRQPGGRVLRERAAVEAQAVEAGYEIVYPETLSLPQQICLFRSAARIAGEYGSGLHGTIFAPSGSVICALRGTSHHPGFAQSGLAERFCHRIGYVFGATPEHAGDREFSVDLDAVRHAFSAVHAWASDKAEIANP